MKRIITVLCLASLFLGCQAFYDKPELCVANEDCPCNLECPKNYICAQHVIGADEESSSEVTNVCVLKNDITCATDEDCSFEAVCLNGFCEEKQCQTLCKLEEACTFYPDNNEAQCSDR